MVGHQFTTYNMELEKRKAKIRSEVLKKHNRETKERYLEGIGFMDMKYIKELDINEINNLVENAMKVKGF